METRIFVFLIFMGCCINLNAQNTAKKPSGVNPQSITANDPLTIYRESLYPEVNSKSWSQLLAEKRDLWRSPYTQNLLIQPVHSPNWIYVCPSMAVSRRTVTEGVSNQDAEKCRQALTQEDLVVQFAFDDPAFVPDFRLTNLSLFENKYPIVSADYYANDVYYKIEYVVTSIGNNQSILFINVKVQNESDKEKTVNVRTKIGYYPEDKMFAYHYIPYSWNATNWMPYDKISMKDNSIYKDGKMIGQVLPGTMNIDWEASKTYTDKQYDDCLYPQVWYGSGYVLSEFRLKSIQDIILARTKISPKESGSFSIKLLIDDKNVTQEQQSTLAKMTPEVIKEQALASFKSQFSKDAMQFDFPTAQLSDILTELQLNTLQLLIKFPDRNYLQPTQGGSSERFYVWVYEAVQMLRPLLRVGQFETVKKGLDYIFALQDAGYPPEGKFTTTAGSIGTTGPRWANTTGTALALASDYYLYSHDKNFIKEYLPKILKAVHWISGEVKSTRKMNADGTRPLTYGVMPFAVSSDGDKGYFMTTDIFTYWGFEKTVRLLECINHKDAADLRRELAMYHSDLLVAFRHLAQPNGKIERQIITDDKDGYRAMKFDDSDIMAPVATVGIMDPKCDIFQKYISYYEKSNATDYFMGKMDRDILYMIQCEHFWQPIYLMLGEWKKAYIVMQTCLDYGMTQDVHQTQERFSKRDPAFAPWQPNGSGNGGIIDMVLSSLYFEGDSAVTLLGAVPFEWLIQNKHTSLKNLYTLTGKVNMEISAINNSTCTLKLSSENPLPEKIRIPEYLRVKVESSAVKRLRNGYFMLKSNTKEVSFKLSMDK